MIGSRRITVFFAGGSQKHSTTSPEAVRIEANQLNDWRSDKAASGKVRHLF